MLKLRQLHYTEYRGKPEYWTIGWDRIGGIAMIVGVNATGKTRLLNVIAALAHLISGKSPALPDGEFSIELEGNGLVYAYNLSIIEKKIELETLDVNGSRMLNRQMNAPHTIASGKELSAVEFGIEPELLAVRAKRDSVQVPYLEALIEWASNVEMYSFTSESNGARALIQLGTPFDFDAASKVPGFAMPLAAYLFESSKRNMSLEFSKAVCEQMTEIGFPISAVSVNATNVIAGFPLAAGIEVREVGRETGTHQVAMSSGMVRALAVIMKLRFSATGKSVGTLLLDDIGEGMDYDRSVKLIKMLLREAAASGVQLLMTTNDRFVMNSVPLEHWAILSRSGGTVTVRDGVTDARQFERFKRLGLTNFDLFQSLVKSKSEK